MLNPPYSKSNGPANQLRFIANALDDLQPSGRCAAIVQMSCALTTKTDVVAQHKALLKYHRLDAVISCPDQLFYPVAVNTCIVLLTAHVPHEENYPTWFGFLKDDGFIIHKRKGRIPVDWEIKKDKFLTVFPFAEAPGLSVRHSVKADDEWCAEAYLETDFSILRRENFESKLRIYLGFQYTSGNIEEIVASAATDKNMRLNVSGWKPFRFDSIFKIKKGFYNKKPPIAQENSDVISFIGATEYSNGVTSVHDMDDVLLFSRNGEENPYELSTRKLFPAHAVTISNNGSVGNAFYQPNRFTCSHDVNPIYLIGHAMSAEIGIFLSTVIEVDKYRWGYGRKWRPTRMPSSIIKLPVDDDGAPDWDFMESYIQSLSHSANLVAKVKPQKLTPS